MSQRFLTETVIGTSFSFFTDDEVRRMSVCRITNPVTFDQFNHPTSNGLYDRLMGPTEFGVLCGSCGLNINECPGHIGHIDLSVPLYNPTLFPLLFRLLRLKCYSCHQFRAPQRLSQILKAKLMLLDCGKIVDVLELDDKLRSVGAAAAAAAVSSSGMSLNFSTSIKNKKKKKPAKKANKQGKKSKKTRRGIDEDEDDDEEEEEEENDNEEEEEEEENRPDPKEIAQKAADAVNDEITRYLRDLEIDCIAQCGPDVGCGLRSNAATQYSQHVRECRATLVNEFLKSFPSKCGNCSAVALSLRKDGFSKIFQVPLSRPAAVAMAAKGITYKSAAGILRIRELRERARKNRVDREAKGKEEEEDDDDKNDAQLASLEAEMEVGAADLMNAAEIEDGEKDGDEEEKEENAEEEEEEEEGGIAKASTKKKAGQSKPNFMPASEVSAQMQLLWEHEAEIVRRVFFPVSNSGDLLRNKIRYNENRTSTINSSNTSKHSVGGWRFFFLRVIPVAPPRFRPPTRLGEAQFEHPQNVYLTKVLKLNYELMDLGLGVGTSESGKNNTATSDVTGGVDMRKALTVWMNLQNTVNGLIDSGKMQTQSGTEAAPGIKQLLEKKEGMFRKYMMGKRVNFAARTVISPDPFLRVDQVGVPLRFAKGLTFKQPVTAWNAAEMRRLVINGPDNWPGATHVEESSGAIIDLSTKSLQQREAMAKKLLLTSGAASAGFDGSSASGFIPSTGPIISSSTLSTQIMQPIDLDPAQGAAAAAAGSLPGVGVTRVWRHLQDNDIVLMNRQPTLHKPSLMAHRARVMKAWSSQQILRFHYANCKSYNADFDGDEMNMHLPQDEIGRAEAETIVATEYQYLSGTGGAPLRGLIQDHNGIAAILTMRDQLLTRDEYCQFVFAALQSLSRFGYTSTNDGSSSTVVGIGRGRAPLLDVQLQPPAIMKPQMRWTGKQVITSLLCSLTAHLPVSARGLNIDGKAKIGDGIWGEASGRKDIIPVGDSQIVVRNNELLVGVLDKNALGNSSYGLIHCVYEAHGPELAGALLSAMGRLLTVYLQHTGITCGVGDLFLTTAADESRKRLIKKAIEIGEQAAAAFVGVSPLPQATSAQISSQGNAEWSEKVRLSIRERLRGGVAGADATGEAAILASVSLDNAVKGSMAKAHSAIIDACLPHGLFRTFPSNQFSLMVQSGAKGSLVNHAMIAVGLGQQELEGRRVPTMASNKTLPCFPAFDPHPRSGGYISDRFLTGLRPQDYFFHCQSGREGLIDTAVKTSRSGYLQRCLIKHLEALRIHYDGSVRDSDGGMVSLKYGEDGIDVIATPYITCTDDQLTFLARNFGALTNTFGMMDKNFSKAIKSLDPKSAGEAYIKIVAARSICAESSSKSLSDTTASQLESQMLKLGLEKGDFVEFRLPSNVSSIVSHLQIHRGDDGESMTMSVRGELPRLETSGKKFLRHAEFNSLTPQFIQARIEKIRKSGRGEGGGGGADEESSSTLSYDLDFEIALPYESPLLWGSSSSSICNVLLRVKKVPMCTNSSLSKGGLLIIRPLIPDPVDSTHSPFTNVGASSEKLLDRLTGYKARNPHSALRKPGEDKRLSHQAFDVLVSIKAARSQVQPGEPVGVIAAQSIGAEATQMTLNTFHLAGGGGVNVTLGIPRLREILMTASVNPTTPQMTLPLARPLDANHDSNGPQARAVAASISRLLSPLPMADLLAIWRTNDGGIVVSESLRQETGGSSWIREYRARLYVADLDAIQACFGLSFNDVVSACATVFAPRLLKILADDARKTARAAGLVGVAAVSSSSSKGKRKSKEDAIQDDAVIEDDNDNNAIETAQGKGNNKKANKGNKKSTRFSKKSIQDDDDIEQGEEKEEEVDEEGGDDEIDGTTAAKEASKKELGGYDDFDAEVQVDEEEEANENIGNGVDTLQEGDDSSSDSSEESSEDEEEEDEEEDVENGVSLKNTKVAVTKKVSKDGTFFEDVPSTVERDARFGGMRANASSNEPWIEVCVVFPASSRKELVLFAAERASKSALVRTVKGIKRAIVARPKIGSEREERTCVMTEGCNIQQMWRLSAELIASNPSMVAAAGTATLSSPTSTIKPTNALSLLKHSDSVVDINRLSSNDINAVLMHYGVEAARMCIVKELRAVFDAYGIGVDVRHLYLIADYMTQGGGFRPMNRAGINAHGSPYLKMSFETCASFLVDALLSNEHERMVSPSARLVVGRVVDSGTGSFDLWAPLNG